MSSRAFIIATFKAPGLQTESLKKVSISRDVEKYSILVMNLTETHIKKKYNRTNKRKEEEIHSLSQWNRRNKRTCKSRDTHKIEEEISATFTRVNDRICYAEIQLDKYNFILIVAYATTLIISEQNPAVMEDFYNSLNEISYRINKSRHLMTTVGDFKAKIATGKNEYPENIGKYGKSRLSYNGRCLLEDIKEHGMNLSIIEPLGLSLIE